MAPAILCSCGCNNRADEHLVLNCRVCTHAFKHSCVGLSATDLRTIKVKRGLAWTCPNCTGFGDSLDALKALIIELKAEISDLKKSRNSPCQIDNKTFEEIVDEIRNRESRRSNLLIFNIPESNNASASDRMTSDSESVARILQTVSMTDISDIKPFRIGKYESGRKPRPIKIKLPEPSTVVDILKKAKLLKNNVEYSGVSLSRDRTPREIAHYKEVKQELDARLATGETDIVLRYRNGMPTITKLN